MDFKINYHLTKKNYYKYENLYLVGIYITAKINNDFFVKLLYFKF